MVTIIGTEKRQTKTGKDFHVMILQGDIEIAISCLVALKGSRLNSMEVPLNSNIWN